MLVRLKFVVTSFACSAPRVSTSRIMASLQFSRTDQKVVFFQGGVFLRHSPKGGRQAECLVYLRIGVVWDTITLTDIGKGEHAECGTDNLRD